MERVEHEDRLEQIFASCVADVERETVSVAPQIRLDWLTEFLLRADLVIDTEELYAL